MRSLTRILRALRDVPGAILISPSDPPGQDDDERNDFPADMPEGILAAPPQRSRSSALAAQPAGDQSVPHASDPGTGIHIVGGFEAPVIGGENPREHPRNRLQKAQDRQNALVKRVRTLEIEAEHRAGIPSLDEQHQKAWAANQEAARALTDRDQNISRLNHLIRDEAYHS
jgi:hypothetical protein